MTTGRSIRLFLADGIPGGIITAEIMNWTGHVMVAPRSRLADLIQRLEAGRTGIYVLSGTDPQGGFKPLIYLGETDNVLKEPVAVAPRIIDSLLRDSDGPPEFPSFELFSRKHDLRAEAREIDGEFVVLAHSQAQTSWIGGMDDTYRALHQRLIEEGVLVPEATGRLRFLRQYAFRSPSAAAAVVLGRTSNGRKEWCVKDTKKTYADWQEEQVAATPQDGGEE